MNIRKKLKSRAGFTLAETLLAVAILMLVSVIVATGIPVARNAYEKVVLSSNAETMLTTAISSLRNELGTAWKVESVTGGVSYFSAATGTRSKLYLSDGTIKLLEYAEATAQDALLGTTQNKQSATARDLVFQSDRDTLGKLTLTATGITLNPSTRQVTVSGLAVNGASVNGLASLSEPLVIDVFSVGEATTD